MLTQKDNDFIRYWEANRLRRKKLTTQLLVGIPAGLLIVVPIIINVASGWYKRATMEANSADFNPMVLVVALLLIVGFSAIFWQRHQWDQYEQHYCELIARREREKKDSARDNATAAPGPAAEGQTQPGAAEQEGTKKSPGDHQGS